MKKVYILFLFSALCGFAQEKRTAYWSHDPETLSSGVTLPPMLTGQQEKNLDLLCRVWGFLKYFHPAVAGDTTLNVDNALFAIIPEVLNSTDDRSIDQLLSNWVDQLGDVPARKQEQPKLTIFREASLPWIENSLLAEGKLRPILLHIRSNRFRGLSRYLGRPQYGSNPDFSREFAYKKAKGDDAGMRLLALFRYWNTVEYFFPSKYLTTDQWDGVLKKFIPIFAAPQTDSAYRMWCLQLVATIHDTHAANIIGDPALNKSLGNYTIPGYAAMVEGKMTMMYLFSDSLQASSGLLPGDQIISINGGPVEKLIDSVAPFIAASNPSSFMNHAVNRLRRSNQPDNMVTINRNGRAMELLVHYAPLSINNVKGLRTGSILYPMYRKMGDDIGYININKIKADSLQVIFREFANTKGLIIDIRAYPSEFVPFKMGYYLKPSPSPFVNFTVVDFDMPGRFVNLPLVINGEENPNYYKGKVIILVNEQTQSQAEYTTMALRTAPNAVVMGSQTSGADGNASNVLLPGGMGSYISALGVYHPDGRPTQGIGIVPDIVVTRTIKGVRAGRDELLEAAMELIRRP